MTSYKRCDGLSNWVGDFSKSCNFISEQAEAQEKTIRILSGQTFRERKEHEQHILGQRSPEEVRDLMYKRAFALELTI